MIHSHYRLSFLLSVLIFLILGLGLNALLQSKTKLLTPKSKVIKIALLRPIEPVPVIPKKIPKIIPPPPVVVKKIVKPKPKKKPKVHKPKPKKIIKKIVKKSKPKKVIKKRVIESIPKTVYHEPIPIVKTQKVPTQKTPINKSPVARVIPDNGVAKKAFLNNVRSKIIANKEYPKIALRRHIEGAIKVRFDITKHGQVTNIRFIQGKRVFQKSVRKTLARTFPVAIPTNMKNKLPLSDISVVLHFNIK